MPISAYDPAGRLKKHALLGTSFAADPAQAEKRRKFKELYAEAKTEGAKGRESTKQRLAMRLEGYAQEQAGRLAQIAEQRAGFEEELAGLKTPQERYSAYPFISPTFATDPKQIEEWRLNKLREFEREYAKKKTGLGTRISSLQEEEAERVGRLVDRLELYNMFLGA